MKAQNKITSQKPKLSFHEVKAGGLVKRGDKRNKPSRGVKECQLWELLEV